MCSIGFYFLFYFILFFELASLSPNSSTLPDAASTNFPSIYQKLGIFFCNRWLNWNLISSISAILAIVLLKLGVVLPEGNTIRSTKVHYYKTQNQGTLEHF